MNDAGLHHILRTILDAKTKTKARDIIGQIGQDYHAIARELVERIVFKRTLEQNALYYKWISEISKQTKEGEIEVRRFVKFTFGLPIIFRTMPEHGELCKRRLGAMDYDEKLKLMDLFAVSSLMKTSEMTEYMEQIEMFYRAKGVQLTHPEDK